MEDWDYVEESDKEKPQTLKDILLADGTWFAFGLVAGVFLGGLFTMIAFGII